MKIALAQMDVKAGMPQRNLETMLRMISDAKLRGCDLIAFPELCVGGYLVGDKHTEDEFIGELLAANDVLREASAGIAILYGNIAVAEGVNQDGRSRKFNAVYAFQDRKAVARAAPVAELPDGVQPKTLLPTYRFFDDERYFTSLQEVAQDTGKSIESLTQPFSFSFAGKTVRVGAELCEDLWCEDYRREGKSLNPTKYLLANGADIIVNLSASPWTAGKHRARDRRVRFLKNDCEQDGIAFKSFLYVNTVGVQNNGKNLITFDGGSTVYNEHAKPALLGATDYREDLLLVDDTDLRGKAVARSEKSEIEQKYDAIIRAMRGIRDMTGAAEHPRHLIALSGGIDSSVTAALLADALGPEKVTGLTMPGSYTSTATLNNAKAVAATLGIPLLTIPIQELVDANIKAIEAAGLSLSMLHKENIQAKIRGTTLQSNVAASLGAIFTNNGNKLETALGYATLYGDVDGAYAPLADLLKTEVFELARLINKRSEQLVIPENLIPDELYRFEGKIAPSAELKANQVDPMKFGYHDALLGAFLDYKKKAPTTVLGWYRDGVLEEKLKLPEGLLDRYGLQDPRVFVEDLEWFTDGIARSVFKRVQSPPIIVTSKTAFGYDLRESILPPLRAKQYRLLKEEVVAMKQYARQEVAA